MVDSATGNSLWADSYSGQISDTFVLQDKLSDQIAACVVSGLVASEMKHARLIPTTNMPSYYAYLRGQELLRDHTREANRQARVFFRKAVETDELYSEAYAALGLTYAVSFLNQWDHTPEELDRAFELAGKAISLDDSQPIAHNVLALVYWGKRQLDLALSEIERAISLDPNNADYYETYAHILIDAHRQDEAITVLHKAMALNPHYPASYSSVKSRAYLYMSQYLKAIDAAKDALSRSPNLPSSYLDLSWNYRALWRHQQTDNPQVLDKALEMAERALSIDKHSPLARFNLWASCLWDKRFDKAVFLAEESIALNPDSTILKLTAARLFNYVGKHVESIRMLEEIASWSTELADAYRLAGRYEEAEKLLIGAFPSEILENSNALKYHQDRYRRAEIVLVLLYCEMGRVEKAKTEAKNLKRVWKDFSVEKWGQREPVKNQERLKREIDALRKAGLK